MRARRDRRTDRRAAQAVTPAVLLALLVGCAGGAGGDGSAPSNETAPSHLAAVATATVSPATADAAFRRAALEPLRPALGDQADTAFAAIDGRITDAAAAFIESLPSTGASGSNQAASVQVVASTARAMVAAQAEAAAAGLITATAAGIGAIDGSAGTYGSDSDDGKILIEVSGDRVTAQIDHRASVGAGPGVELSEHTTGSIEAELCPDANGVVTITIDVETQASVTGAGGRIDHTLDVNGTATATVDDQAEITETAFDITVGSARQQQGDLTTRGAGSSPNSYVEVHSTGRAGAGDSSWTADAQLTRASTDANTDEAARLAQMSVDLVNTVTKLVLDKASSLWKNGHCVEIVLEGAGDENTVDPGGSLSFRAKVVHKFEGGDLETDLTASLDGETSLDPASAKSPVGYDYRAPDGADKVAIATLETRSRRGIATKKIRFVTGTGAFHVEISGTFTYSLTGLETTAQVSLEPVDLEASGDAFRAETSASSEVTFDMRAIGCKSTTSQTGTIELLAKKDTRDGVDVLVITGGKNSGTPLETKCGAGGAIVDSSDASVAGSFINVGEIVVPAAEGSYPFSTSRDLYGVKFHSEGTVVLSRP